MSILPIRSNRQREKGSMLKYILKEQIWIIIFGIQLIIRHADFTKDSK